MTQQTPLAATAVAVDITAALEDGCYIAQPRGLPGQLALIYATAEAAPDDLAGWFQCPTGESFIFSKGTGIPPTWVRIDPVVLGNDPAAGVPVSIARTDADE